MLRFRDSPFAFGSGVTAEVYNPADDTWTVVGQLNSARWFSAALLLTNGQVLIIGGMDHNVNPVRTAELYDPVSQTWTYTGSMTNGRYDFTATLLPNGNVLAAGGNVTLFARPSAELYDPLSGNWSPTGNMLTEVAYHTATLMTNGNVLFTCITL